MKLIKSFGYALRGVKFGLQEQNMKIHVIVTLIVIFLGIGFSITALEWAVILLCIGFVIATELLNTAIEEMSDLHTSKHPDTYPRAGKPKDIGAGAVLVAAVISGCVGLLIFVPYFLAL